MSRSPSWASRRAQVKKHAHNTKNKLEESLALQLEEAGLPVLYESADSKIKYTKKQSTYTPDFHLPNGILIESKGYFLPEDRSKHLLIQKQHPEKDIRFIFSNSKSKLKNSKTTYGAWCERHGFLYADKKIPAEWLVE